MGWPPEVATNRVARCRGQHDILNRCCDALSGILYRTKLLISGKYILKSEIDQVEIVKEENVEFRFLEIMKNQENQSFFCEKIIFIQNRTLINNTKLHILRDFLN